MNIKSIITIAIMAIITNQAMGQGPIREAAKEKIKARKVAFITEKINLSVEEAQIFWPLYNEYEGHKETLQREKADILKKIVAEYNDTDESELEQLSDEFVEMQVKEAQLSKEYHEEFKKVLPVRKVLKLYKAENEFKRYLLEELQKRRENRRRPRRQ
jgi:hypothetical protein